MASTRGWSSSASTTARAGRMNGTMQERAVPSWLRPPLAAAVAGPNLLEGGRDAGHFGCHGAGQGEIAEGLEETELLGRHH